MTKILIIFRPMKTTSRKMTHHASVGKSGCGVLLAGGRSQRLPGGKENLQSAHLTGGTLLSHACSQLRHNFAHNYFLGTKQTETSEGFEFICDADSTQGPLSALKEFISQCDYQFAFVLPIDMPLLRDDEIRDATDFVAANPASYFACDSAGGACFPLIIHQSDYVSFVNSASDRLFAAAKQVGAKKLPSTLISEHGLLNINAPGDWEKFQEVCCA